MRTSLFILAAILTAQPTEWDSTGTIVVVMSSIDRIVIGADSKMTSFDAVSKKEVITKTCKIMALKQRAVFVMSGRDGHTSGPHPELTWNAHDIAKKVALQYKQNTNIETIAKAWGVEVASRDNSDLQRGVIDSRSGIGGQQGQFIGFIKHRPAVYLVTVLPGSSGKFSMVATEQDLHDGDFHPSGVDDIAMEIGLAQTDRSKQWISEYKRSHPEDLSSAVGMKNLVKWLIDMTIQYSARKIAVGEPVDIVEITDSTLQWDSKQSSCQ